MGRHSISRLTQREIGTLFLPLAITSTMMSVSVPVINAGLARHPDAQANLAAFGLAFSLSIFLESPVFALQQSVVAWYRGRGSIREYILFAAGVGCLMFAIMAAVAFSPVGPFLLRTLMGAPEALVGRALHALMVATAFPILVAVRLGFQGVLIARRNSAPIAFGTFMRLLLLSVLIVGVCPRIPVEAPAAAMAALAAAVLIETVYVAYAVSRTPERTAASTPAQERGSRHGGRVLFLLPLAGTMALGALTNPLINSIISRTPDPEAALAVYSVVASLVWFLASPTLRFSAVTIALGDTAAHLRTLRRFLWRVVGGVSLLVLLIYLTPGLDLILERGIGLSPELAARARFPLVLLSLQPLVAAFIAYHQGVLTRGDRTKWVGLGGVSRMAAIALVGMAGLLLHADGGLLGGILLGSAFTAEMLTLLAVRRLA
jgi:hypothetical protein